MLMEYKNIRIFTLRKLMTEF